MTIAVTGANSSVGRNLLAHVAGRPDIAATAVVRSGRAAATLPAGDNISPRIVAYDDVDRLAEALGGAECVVHLVGILIETRSTTYRLANVASTSAVVAASSSVGGRHIVLVSVIGASVDAPNRYLRSKGEAERIVAECGMSATILRTPILLGPGTAGADALVRAARGGRARLLGGGRYTMRPLDLDDLSEAILRVCRSRPEGVRTLELVGPEPIRHRDLVARGAGIAGREVTIGTVPVWAAKAGAAVTSRLRGGGVTPTVIDVITADEVVEENADAELGIELTPLDATLGKVMAGQGGTR